MLECAQIVGNGGNFMILDVEGHSNDYDIQTPTG